MSISRRSLLKTLGTLPAAWSLRTFAADPQAQMDHIGPHRAPTTWSPNSAYVLLEGPWLIYPTGTEMTARTIGKQLDSPSDDPKFVHNCVFQYWQNGKDTCTEVPILPGSPWTVNAQNSISGGDFGELFTDAWDRQSFVWANTDTVNPKDLDLDRYVTLTLPSKIHIAGIQMYGQVNGEYLYDWPVSPHIVTILEYDPLAGNPVSLPVTVTAKGQPTKKYGPYGPGDQLVFRMRHEQTKGDELQHIRDSFHYIQRELSDTWPSIYFTIDTSSDYYAGDSYGFSDDEMGLNHPGQAAPPPCQKDANYSNCCGGTIIAGGGTPPLRKTRKR